jgi:hydrogenase nickel incorporation protein HypA/HybF
MRFCPFLRIAGWGAYNGCAMHELSFAADILECVERQAQAYPDAKVVRVRVGGGEMLSVDPGSLAFCFEGISVGTVAEGAKFEWVERGAEIECPKCGRVPAPASVSAVCPKCGQDGVMASGLDLFVEEIELL